MMIGMGLLWLAVIVGFIWLARDGLRQRRQLAPEAALDLLDRRFAEGAISIDDYHQRHDILTGTVTFAGVGADKGEGSER